MTASAARSMAASKIPRRLEGKAAVVSASMDGLVLNNGSFSAGPMYLNPIL